MRLLHSTTAPLAGCCVLKSSKDRAPAYHARQVDACIIVSDGQRTARFSLTHLIPSAGMIVPSVRQRVNTEPTLEMAYSGSDAAGGELVVQRACVLRSFTPVHHSILS